MLSRVQLFVTPGNVAYQASLSMGFPRQEYWSGLPFASPGDLPDPGFKPTFLTFPALAGRFFSFLFFFSVKLCILLLLFFFTIVKNQDLDLLYISFSHKVYII